MLEIRTVHVDRYITPFREGGSLPGLVAADDGFMYVLKFRGAGQGCKALIADFIGGELARKCGLRMPELVFADLPEGYGRTEPDEEIQDLLKWSTGINLGVHYLQGAITFDPVLNKVEPYMASKIVWLDAFLMNIDRTPRNTNMLFWHNELWLIDHGASLYFHHNPEQWEEQSKKPFIAIKDHVLLSSASKLNEVHYEMLQRITPDVIKEIVAAIPTDWLASDPGLSTELYEDFLTARLVNSEGFLNEAIHAR